MDLVLAQTQNRSGWQLLFQVGVPVLIFVVIPLLKKLKDKAEERAIEKRARSVQSAAEMEAIRTGRGLEQVLMGLPAAGSAPVETPSLPDSNDPKVRRERQLAELRRRAAARGGQPVVQSPAPPVRSSTARQLPMPTQSQPMPQLVRQPAPAQPVRIQLPGGGSVVVGQGQSPPPRPAARPQPKPVPQQRTQKMTNEQAARVARERQAVPTRVQNTQVSDMASSSETHRLVADTDAAKVTARAERKGPKLGRAGLRQAILMTEIFGKPRSERLDEI